MFNKCMWRPIYVCWQFPEMWRKGEACIRKVTSLAVNPAPIKNNLEVPLNVFQYCVLAAGQTLFSLLKLLLEAPCSRLLVVAILLVAIIKNASDK
jgi:hypothetical protein